jgi:hypothetical protein
LADEKQALEEKLVHEKTALHNEKQGLEEQLRAALLKLEEAEELLGKEKALREQMECMHRAVVEENASLQQSLREQMDEASSAKTELLRFQASAERDGKLVETLRQRVDEGESRIAELTDEAEGFRQEKAEWESEREDLLNQTEVLTEERDAARQNEEELYEELRERTNDLEKLQESYVDMTDRCNEYQDTISDLREEVESMKNMVMDDHRLFVSAPPSVAATPAAGPSESFAQTPNTSYVPGTASAVSFTSQSAPRLSGIAHVFSAAEIGKSTNSFLSHAVIALAIVFLVLFSNACFLAPVEEAGDDLYILDKESEKGKSPRAAVLVSSAKPSTAEAEEEEEYAIDDEEDDEGGNEDYEEDEFENDFED